MALKEIHRTTSFVFSFYMDFHKYNRVIYLLGTFEKYQNKSIVMCIDRNPDAVCK